MKERLGQCPIYYIRCCCAVAVAFNRPSFNRVIRPLIYENVHSGMFFKAKVVRNSFCPTTPINF